MSDEAVHSEHWVDLIAAEDVPRGSARTVVVNSQAYAVCNDDGRFAVVDDACPHAGGSLGKGIVANGRITCRWHQYEWELATGSSPHSRRRLRIYPCRAAAGRVQALLRAGSP